MAPTLSLSRLPLAHRLHPPLSTTSRRRLAVDIRTPRSHVRADAGGMPLGHPEKHPVARSEPGGARSGNFPELPRLRPRAVRCRRSSLTWRSLATSPKFRQSSNSAAAVAAGTPSSPGPVQRISEPSSSSAPKSEPQRTSSSTQASSSAAAMASSRSTRLPGRRLPVPAASRHPRPACGGAPGMRAEALPGELAEAHGARTRSRRCSGSSISCSSTWRSRAP